MARDNETTTKFNVDISDLKKGIQEANRQIRLANAQFKSASAGMDDWGKSADGVKSKITQLETTVKAQNAILTNYEKQLELVANEYGENSAEADNMRIKVENQRAKVIEAEKSLGVYKTRLTELEKAQEGATEATEEQGGAYDKLKTKINTQQTELEQLKADYKNVATEQGATSDEAQALAGKIEELSGELKENKKALNDADSAADEFDQSLQDVGDEADNTTSGGLTAFGVALGNLAADLIQNAINKMKDLITETIEVGRTFDSSMSQVGAVSGASGEDLDALREKAKEMGSTTKFTASEAAEAFNYMAMAGWKTEDMLDGINGILNLAAASGSDLGTTSDIVTDALTAMGYSAKDAGRLADVMAAASSNANTNVEMMGQTFQYAAPIVGAMGYSMEDTAEQIGLMANAGIKGEKAGTALRSILSRLAAPPKEAADAMDALGISLTDSEGNMKSLDEVMADLRGAFDGLSETQRTQYAKQIAGQEAMSGLLAIVNAAPADVDKLSDAITNCDGAAEDMANTMLDNLGGDMTLLSSKMEGVQLAIYEKFEPALRAGVDALDKLLDGVQFVVDHSTEFIAALGAMAAGVAAYVAYTTAVTVMTKGWQALTIVTKAQAAAQAALNAVMALNPIGLVIAAIVGLVAAFVILWNKSEAFRNFWINLWETIKQYAGDAWEAISGFFTGAWEKIQEIWGTVTQWFSDNVITPLTEFFTGAWETITGIFQSIWDKIVEIFGPAFEWFGALFTSIWNSLVSIINVIIGLVKGSWLAIQAIWGVVSGWFNKHVIKPIKSSFSKMWNGIKTAASTAWSGIKAVWDVVSGWFNDNIIKPVKNFFGGMWDKLKSGASDAWEGIKSVFKNVSDWFKNTFSKAWQKVKDVFSTGGKVFDGIKDGIVSAFKTVVNAIIRGINKVIEIPFNAINKVLNKIRNIKIAKIKPFKNMWDKDPLAVPQIPELATGGVLEKGQVGLLEGKGAEAVVPLDRNKKWIAKTAHDLKGALQAEGILGGGAQQMQNINYTFNQTNNSPKALSRLEIYRQTKNQLNFAKGV